MFALICGTQKVLFVAQKIANLGLPAKNVMILIDTQCTRKNILRELHNIAKHAPSGSTIIIYFNTNVLTDCELNYEFIMASEFGNKLRVICISDVGCPNFDVTMFQDSKIEVISIIGNSQAVFEKLEITTKIEEIPNAKITTSHQEITYLF